jgi:hypothetical protein
MNNYPIIAKYYISSSTMGHKKRWYRLLVNGEKTNYEVNKHGYIRNIETKNELKPMIANGYYTYKIRLLDGSIASLTMHRILSCIFIPIPKMLIDLGYNQMTLIPNHKDGDKLHTELSNLEWTTVSGNMQHALDHGLCDTYIGEKSHLAKITEKDAIAICELLSTGMRPRQVSEELGIGLKTVRHIFSGECWKHISKNYDFKKDDKFIPYKYTDETVYEVCKLLEEKKYLDREIGTICGVSDRYVNDIKNHKRRTDISSKYNF